MQRTKRFTLLIILVLISLVAMRTILAQDNNGNGRGNGNGNGSSSPIVQPTQNSNNGNHTGKDNGGNANNGSKHEQTPIATAIPQQSNTLLGCQKNNPNRLDCSSLDVSGTCDGNIAVFTIHNSGEPGNGDMRAPTEYRLLVDGVVVQTGSIQLAGGSSTQITYSGRGSVTLEADQQIGHPGNSHPRVSFDCGESSQTPTIEPTVTTTPTIEAPALSAEVICNEDGSVTFIITNNGGDMLQPAYYTVSNPTMVIDSGDLSLLANEQSSLQYWGSTSLTLVVSDLIVVTSPECVTSTAEPTPTITPTASVSNLNGQYYCQDNNTILFAVDNYGTDPTETLYYFVTDSNNNLVTDGTAQIIVGQSFLVYVSGYTSLTFTIGDLVIVAAGCNVSTPEPTATVDNSNIVGEAYCNNDGAILFVITNIGEDMPDYIYYTVTDNYNALVADGWLQLLAGESTSFEYWGYSQLNFTLGSIVIAQNAECIPPTTEPTIEPTQEITPTAQPTNEVTPTVEPTQIFTPTPTQTGTLGCQKNNPDRTDCSSLQVTATCQDGVAVFTIRNTGKFGEGDMLTSTQYRIIVDGIIVQIGTVQLIGGSSIQITYSSTGSITLEADQQTGHPGKSQPQASVSCS